MRDLLELIRAPDRDMGVEGSKCVLHKQGHCLLPTLLSRRAIFPHDAECSLNESIGMAAETDDECTRCFLRIVE